MVRDELLFNLAYGYWFNLFCERFYKRVDFLLNFVQLVGGSSAAYGVAATSPNWVTASGIALAVCAALSLLLQLAVKAEQHLQAKLRFLEITEQAPRLDDAALHVAVAQVQRSGPAGLSSLGDPAFNAALDALGREGKVPLSRFKWLMSALV